MTSSSPASQWNSLLCNLGAWQGSFTRMTPQGVIQEDIPSLVTLTGVNENRAIHQTVQHFSAQTGEILYNKVLEFSSLSRSILFFETGEFSQGSIQWGPFSEFGAELGFIQGDRRLRMVQLFDQDSQFSHLTLIREHRQGTPSLEQPPLTIEMLVGQWQGEAVTLYPDWQSPTHSPTHLSVQVQGERLIQHLTAPGIDLTSTAAIDGNVLRFDEGKFPIQVLLLPGGASSNTPVTIPRGQPFFLEAGWLVHETLRQRIIRSYDAKGGWSSVTLVTEQKVVP